MGIEQDKIEHHKIEHHKIDLACALRAAAELGLHEGVCNHFSYALDAETFLINPQGIHWLELVPSDIVTVDAAGNRVAGNRAVEPTAFFIHSRIHRAKPSARCIMHAHMPYATALTLLQDGKLEWCSQNAVRFYGRIAYDTQYNGLALDDAEGDRICATLADADILFMANHGVMVCGDGIANVFDDLYYLERAAMVQVLAQSTCKALRLIPDAVVAQTARQHEQERQQSALHLEALKRRLDQTDPGWSQR
jgi:ribulose-5-phosphate 4-epimerase/fuculose-1-phosphate aldolase